MFTVLEQSVGVKHRFDDINLTYFWCALIAQLVDRAPNVQRVCP